MVWCHTGQHLETWREEADRLLLLMMSSSGANLVSNTQWIGPLDWCRPTLPPPALGSPLAHGHWLKQAWEVCAEVSFFLILSASTSTQELWATCGPPVPHDKIITWKYKTSILLFFLFVAQQTIFTHEQLLSQSRRWYWHQKKNNKCFNKS